MINCLAVCTVTNLDGFVGRQEELRILDERLSDAETGRPQVVFVEAEAGAGKSTLLSWFLALHPNVVAVSTSGDEAETLLSYGVMDQLLPGALTEPGADPMAIGAQSVSYTHLSAKAKSTAATAWRCAVGNIGTRRSSG